jgi:hypothetical protein
VQPAQIIIESAIGSSFIVLDDFACGFFMMFFQLVEAIVSLGHSPSDEPDDEWRQRGHDGQD